MDRRIEISPKTILYAFLLALLAWAIFQLTEVIILLFVSFILMAALNPIVDRLQRLKLPRSLAIMFVYIVLWVIVGGIIAGLVPGIVDQTTKFFHILPSALGKIEFFNLHQQEINGQVLTYISTLPGDFVNVVVRIFGNLINFLSMLVISFYLLLYRPHLEKYLASWFGEKQASKITDVLIKIEHRLGNWVRGELVLMLAVGFFTYLGLVVLGIDTAIPLALLAGLFEIIPNIGPTLSAIPAILVALTIHPLTAASTIALYFIVQFAENNFLVPKIMQRAVGVNPIISIVGIMVGVRLAGATGALLAIPVIITAQAVIPEIRNWKTPGSK